MPDEARKDVADMTVAELRARASELEITGRSSMNKAELRQAVLDAEEQVSALGAGDAAEPASTGDGGPPASEIPAPSIGPHTQIEHTAPEERLARHEQSSVDAMGLHKRREVTGKSYGPSFTKQASLYGGFLVILAIVLIGGKLLADELDAPPATNPDEAPWSQADAEQRPPTPIDFPRNPSP